MTRSFTAALVIALLVVSGAGAPALERVPWKTSHIQGSPEPPPPFRVERAYPKLTFTSPLDAVVIPGTKRIVVVQQHGKLFSIPNEESTEQAEVFADLKQFDPEVAESYGMAFHPRFAENRLAFVWINFDLHGKPTVEDATRIVRFRVTKENPPTLDLTSAQTVFTWLGGGHNGGNVRFGPDGMLYISTGDASFPDPPDAKGTGQDITDVLASVLRIDVDRPGGGKAYGIPKDNPFIDTPRARPEVWAYGFRNPWRLSFDRKTGVLWVGDVGWELWESIVRVERGGNYGWSITEGGRQDVRPDRPRGPTLILSPAAVHPHQEAASITGGEVYFGKRLPELAGAYIYGDWQLGTFWALREGGKPQELCRSPLMPTGFGTTPDGELLICDGGGGGLWRLSRNPEAGKPSSFPRQLSQTGLFMDVAKQKPAAGVVPYEINAERWADFARAERSMALPDQANVNAAEKDLGVMTAGRWVLPAGAVFAKTYSLEMERGRASTARRIETQLLHYDGQQWAAYAYRWNDAQTDADLVPAAGDETVLEVHDATATGGVRRQVWRHYGRAECLRCHNLWNNFTPGFSTLQLDRPTTVAPGDQLDLFAHLGLAINEPKLTAPHGDRGKLETRARSYLHANCATCHRKEGGGSVPSWMNVETPLAEARLLDARPVQGDLGLAEGRVIASGDPARSVLLYRMATAGRGHMPYLGGRLVDDRGVLLIRDWIASMPLDSKTSEATQRARESRLEALDQLRAGDTGKALDELLADPSGALGVALAVIDGSLPPGLREQAIVKGSALPDPLRRDLFERFLPDEQRRKVLGVDFSPEIVLDRTGDAERGQRQFEALCANCHRVGDRGRNFGPDLGNIGKKHDHRALLEQIMQPAKVIEPPWLLTTVTLKNGDSHSGFVSVRSGGAITLNVAGGEAITLAGDAIATTSTERVSIMPEGLLQGLTADEAADLLSFLEAPK